MKRNSGRIKKKTINKQRRGEKTMKEKDELCKERIRTMVEKKESKEKDELCKERIRDKGE